MKAGGADPSAVLDIISDHVPADIESGVPVRRIAEDVVHALEAGGYRIVRAGMVPRLDELEHTARVLRATASETQGVPTMADQLRVAAVNVTAVRALAAAALGLDLADVDQPDGTES